VKRMIPGVDQNSTGSWIKDNGREYVPTVSEPATEAAQQWDGWGTALKPAQEPIVLARRPFRGTVAANLLAHGTGAINVGACAIDTQGRPARESGGGPSVGIYGIHGSRAVGTSYSGRHPANVLLDEDAAAALDEQSGVLAGGHHPAVRAGNSMWAGEGGGLNGNEGTDLYTDAGGASRFFYTAKASRTERSEGLGHRNTHPTVKPVEVMAYLVKLVTPPGGVVLDPFLGSGTTAIAAIGNGMDYVGIERESEYVEIARQRIGLGARVIPGPAPTAR